MSESLEGTDNNDFAQLGFTSTLYLVQESVTMTLQELPRKSEYGDNMT